MKIVAVGFTCVDVYEHLNRCYPTGNGVDFAIHMRRFGEETSIVSVVGNDEFGKLMADALKKENIDYSHLHVAEGSTTVIKMNLDGNDRVHGEEIEGVMANFALTDHDIAFIAEHDYVHTDLFGKVLGSLPLFKENGNSIIFDFSTFLTNPDVEQILPHVDYAFFSYQKHDSYIVDYMKWAKRLGPQVVTVTLGENGSIAYDGEHFYTEGIMPVEVVNTVGAGDSFIAGFMYGVIHNKTVQDCLKSGTKSAAEVVTKFEPY